MTIDQLFTTGKVLGLTRLKIATVQRYIKTFPEFFSDTARIPTRGRRFTGEDVKILLLIKHLYSSGENKSEITKALNGEKELPAVAWFEFEDMFEIATRATHAAARAEEILADMKEHSRMMKFTNNRVLRDFEKIKREVVNVMYDTRRELKSWIKVYKQEQIKRADDWRFVLNGNLSDNQFKRMLKKNMAYDWDTEKEDTLAEVDEWEKRIDQPVFNVAITDIQPIKRKGFGRWLVDKLGGPLPPD
jgi:DNA-binding transcriptional MerR regulator